MERPICNEDGCSDKPRWDTVTRIAKYQSEAKLRECLECRHGLNFDEVVAVGRARLQTSGIDNTF